MPTKGPIARLYPLHGLRGQGQIWSWISFDVANQSFTLLINTVLFSIFFKEIVLQGSPRSGTIWSVTFAVSMGLVVLASPIAGAIGDQRAWKKEALLGTGLLCAALTCSLALIQPGQLWLAVLLYIPANFCFAIGENFLASFLPQLAPREDFGRVSGFSWGVAYFAALLLLAVTAATISIFKLATPDQWRPFFVFAGLWFFAFAIPTLVFLREKRPADQTRQPLIASAFRSLASSLGTLRSKPDLATLLLATLLYSTATYTVIAFASILASEFGFKSTQLVIFIAVLTIAGIFGTAVPTVLQDRLGHRRTTTVLLILWIFAALLMAIYARLHTLALADPAAAPFPTWPMWALGCVLGFGLGALGSANRAFFGYLTPASRTAEYFGIWGMVVKLAAVLTIPFGVSKDLLGTPAALLVLTAFLVAGLLVTLRIDERRGAGVAEAEDARHARPS